MSDVKKVFTLVNKNEQYLKYFYANHSDLGQVVQFNTENTQQRFHTCGSQKCADKILARALELGFDCSIVEVDPALLVTMQEASKEMPRQRNAFKKLANVEQEVNSAPEQPATTEAPVEETVQAEPEIAPEEVVQEAPKKKKSAKKEAPAEELAA